MSRERALDDIVTEFMLNTCRLRPQPTTHRVQAAMNCGALAGDRAANDKNANFIPLITGSAAEFYIEPILSHLGDIDVMYYINTDLAVPRGHPPPTQLPAEFHNYIKVYEMTSHLRLLTVTYLAMCT